MIPTTERIITYPVRIVDKLTELTAAIGFMVRYGDENNNLDGTHFFLGTAHYGEEDSMPITQINDPYDFIRKYVVSETERVFFVRDEDIDTTYRLEIGAPFTHYGWSN